MYYHHSARIPPSLDHHLCSSWSFHQISLTTSHVPAFLCSLSGFLAAHEHARLFTPFFCKSSNPLPIFPFITGEESGLCLFVCYCYCSARYCYRFPHSLDTGLLIGLASIHDKAERGECLFCQKIHSGRYHLTVIPTMYTGKQMKHLKYKDRKIWSYLSSMKQRLNHKRPLPNESPYLKQFKLFALSKLDFDWFWSHVKENWKKDKITEKSVRLAVGGW